MSYAHFSADCGEHHDLLRDFGGPRPAIIVLCGSTRHPDAWQKTFYTLQMDGFICLTAAFPPSDGDAVVMDARQKIVLDGLWRHHIDLADKVLVLNVGGYIGDSTRSEIEYAVQAGKPISYLEPVPAGVERSALSALHEITREVVQEAGAA